MTSGNDYLYSCLIDCFIAIGPVSSINAQTESHGSSSEEVDEPSSRSSSRPNSAHEEQVELLFNPHLKSNSLLKSNLINLIDLRRYFITFRTIRSALTDVWMRYSIWILILNRTHRYSRPKVPKEYSIKRQARFTKRLTSGRQKLSIELA